MGLDPCNQKAHKDLSKAVGLQGSVKPTLGLGLSSPCNFEAGECSISSPKVLETSYHNYLANPSSGRNEINAGKRGQHSPTRLAPKPNVLIGPEVTPTMPISPEVTPTVLERPEEMTHTFHNLISAIGNSNRSMLMPVVSSATVFSTIALEVMGSNGCGGRSNQTQPFTMSSKPVGAVQVASELVPTYSDLMVSALVSLTS